MQQQGILFDLIAGSRKFTIYQPIILYRKFSADFIFNGYELLQHQVLITDDAGVIIDLVPETAAGDHIEELQGIICPGFINAHCHLELSHMKGLIPKHSGLVDFLLKVITGRHFDETTILTAIEDAETDMLQNGIVAVGDICNNTHTIRQKSLGRLQYHNFIEVAGFIPALAKDRFDKAILVLDEYRLQLAGSRSTVSPHAPYSVSPELFAMVNDATANSLMTIHNQETEAENEFMEKGSGDFTRLYKQIGIDIGFFKTSAQTSLQTWLPYFTKPRSILLVHNVATTAADIAFLQRSTNNDQRSNYLCLCPNANLYISNQLPDVKMLMQHAEHIVLGTDSLASNDQLSILDEMKTLQQQKQLPLAALLQWATSNGARALQLDKQLGSFEKGKQPGLVLISGVEHTALTAGSLAKRIL